MSTLITSMTKTNPAWPAIPHAISGNYYDASTLIAVSAQGSLLLTANRLYLVPALLGAGTINLLSLGVSGAVAASTMRMGVYADPPVGGVFGAPLIDSGDVTTATTGARPSGALTYRHPGGLLWLAVLPSAAITVGALTQTAQTIILGQATQNTVTRNGGVYFDTSYGALPSNATITGYITGNCPQVQARVA